MFNATAVTKAVDFTSGDAFHRLVTNFVIPVATNNNHNPLNNSILCPVKSGVQNNPVRTNHKSKIVKK